MDRLKEAGLQFWQGAKEQWTTHEKWDPTNIAPEHIVNVVGYPTFRAIKGTFQTVFGSPAPEVPPVEQIVVGGVSAQDLGKEMGLRARFYANLAKAYPVPACLLAVLVSIGLWRHQALLAIGVTAGITAAMVKPGNPVDVWVGKAREVATSYPKGKSPFPLIAGAVTLVLLQFWPPTSWIGRVASWPLAFGTGVIVGYGLTEDPGKYILGARGV